MEEERRFKRFDAPKPVVAGDEIDVTIESVGGQGDGIAKVSGFVIFVKGARKGETCKVKIGEVKRTYATAERIGEATSEPASSEEEEAPEEEESEEASEEDDAVEESEEENDEREE
ncbi:MAG: TRAM domain-containing protein [Candidatus Micrarchaeota archaeon]